MKKEHVLVLLAGFVLGLVVCYIVMKQQAQTQGPAPAATASAQPDPGPGSPPGEPSSFDPNQHNSMIAQFIEKAKSDPKDFQSKMMLGNIYYDKGDFSEAIPWYEEALKLQPGNTDILVDLGVCFREMKAYNRALELFEQALTIDPVKKQALHNRVVVYGMDLKQRDKADQALKAFEKAYPGDPAIQQLKDALPH